ncbi:MAG TPA: hypothetical protein VHI52_13855 [Verrucomicrobiae bacterium]|nr:hypothetical protein [Verrucomicrobiae bacterium]
MNTLIEPIESAAQRDAATRIREEVFGREWRHQVTSPFEGSHAALHLLARSSPEGAAVATLSVVDTTADRNLHDSYGLAFDGRVKVARYTQLAVLKPYRGMNLPLRLILEAHRRFVVPGHFAYTWLLYRPEHAAESSLCRLLGFQPGTGTFESPYGPVRTLVRREAPAVAGEEIWRPQSPAGIAKTETVVSVFSSTAQ